jgi:hypothetical protein
MNPLLEINTFCSQFWSDFFPNFTSTVLGLILGLPFALWTNRKIANSENNERQKEIKIIRENALKVLRKALDENCDKLQSNLEQIKNRTIAFDLELDISAWEIVKDDISENLYDLNLKKNLAFHFHRLNSITFISRMYLDHVMGIPATIDGNKNNKEALRNYLIKTIDKLSSEASDLKNLIDTEFMQSDYILPKRT